MPSFRMLAAILTYTESQEDAHGLAVSVLVFYNSWRNGYSINRPMFDAGPK